MVRPSGVVVSTAYEEALAAYEWGIGLDKWYLIPPAARAMMIAFIRQKALLEAVLQQEQELDKRR